jgi:hypothetical protein
VTRRLGTLAAAASLLLCIATVALWVRTYREQYALAYVDDIDDGTNSFLYLAANHDRRPAWSRHMWHDAWCVSSARGVVYVAHDRSDTTVRSGGWLPKGWHCWAKGHSLPGAPTWVLTRGQFHWAGFAHDYREFGPPADARPGDW